MLTVQEMEETRDKLRQADALVAHVRGIFLAGSYVSGARALKAALGLLADQVSALHKAISTGKQP